MNKKNIILVSVGCFQSYILDNIKQLLKFNFNIYVITNKRFFKLLKFNNIKKINSEDLNINFDKKSKLNKKFRNGFWNYCSKRLFLVYEYIKINNIQNVIHIENDVLLYSNLDYNFENKVYLTMDSNNRCIPSIIYIPNYSLLNNLIKNYDYNKNDMVNMANYYKNNKNIVETLPIINNSIKKSKYNNNFDVFNSIFDGAAIGQYLGGVDPRNKKGNTIGFINETCVIKYNKYKFKWIEKDGINMPYIIIDNKPILINNLHIHCKNLKKFML